MNLQNAEILLTVKEEGCVVRNTESTKERVKFFYHERDNYSLQNPSLPRNTKMSIGVGEIEHRSLVPSECSRKTRLNSNFVAFAINPNEIPYGVDKYLWKKYSQKQRLEFHLYKVSEGKKFTYEVI